MTLDAGWHLHGDACPVVEVLEHVLTLGILGRVSKGLLHGEPVGHPLSVVQRGALGQAYGSRESSNTKVVKGNNIRPHGDCRDKRVMVKVTMVK